VPDTVLSVAVCVGEAEDHGADLVQVYESEPGKVRGRRAWLRSPVGGHEAFVADLPWEGGDLEEHWREARKMRRWTFLMLAGGLGPENVRELIERFSARGTVVSPWAVDASSSLESAPGIKDHAKVRAFVEAARG
jgi:phosphoribosylanthranilate isomerase